MVMPCDPTICTVCAAFPGKCLTARLLAPPHRLCIGRAEGLWQWEKFAGGHLARSCAPHQEQWLAIAFSAHFFWLVAVVKQKLH